MRTIWPEVALGEICTLSYGKSLPAAKRSGAGCPVYGSNGAVGLHAATLTSGPAIVVGRKGSCGEVHFSPTPCWPIDTTYYVDQGSTSADLRWLYYRMRSLGLTSLNRAAAIPGLNRDDAYRQRLLLPPIEEQRRIAAVLDQADELRAKRRESLDLLDSLTEAIFLDMFGDPFSPNTPTQPLAAVARIVMGQSPAGQSYNDRGEGVPLLNGPSEFGARHPTAVQWTSSPTRMSLPGDILICVRGATAGRLNWSDSEYCLGRGLAAVRAPSSTSAFLYRVLTAYYPWMQAKGVGSTFINISKHELHELPVPIARSAASSAFGDFVDGMSALTASAGAQVQAFDELFVSLRQRALSGAL